MLNGRHLKSPHHGDKSAKVAVIAVYHYSHMDIIERVNQTHTPKNGFVKVRGTSISLWTASPDPSHSHSGDSQ